MAVGMNPGMVETGYDASNALWHLKKTYLINLICLPPVQRSFWLTGFILLSLFLSPYLGDDEVEQKTKYKKQETGSIFDKLAHP